MNQTSNALPLTGSKPLPAAVPLQPLTYSVLQACKVSSLGRTSIFAHIKSGRLQITKVGRRTLIRADSLHALLGMTDA